MPEEPRYWGSWKGRAVKAIAIDGAPTWTDIRESTGLSPKSLQRVLAELFQFEDTEKRGEGGWPEYRVSHELYEEYREFFGSEQGPSIDVQTATSTGRCLFQSQ